MGTVGLRLAAMFSAFQSWPSESLARGPKALGWLSEEGDWKTPAMHETMQLGGWSAWQGSFCAVLVQRAVDVMCTPTQWQQDRGAM